MKRIAKTIEAETPILPHVIAGAVITEALLALGGTNEVAKQVFGNDKATERLIETFTDKADTLYNTNTKFRKRVRRDGDEGRDFLYTVMRNWVGAHVYETKPDFFVKLPETFRMGIPMDKGGSVIQHMVEA